MGKHLLAIATVAVTIIGVGVIKLARGAAESDWSLAEVFSPRSIVETFVLVAAVIVVVVVIELLRSRGRQTNQERRDH